MLVLFLLSIDIPPIGSHPSTWEKYKDNIDLIQKTFRCFDGSKTIPLSNLNDNYIDCLDGSDEPGTSAYPNGTFYCRNRDIFPSEIPKWSVGDGICDCCDGSDEILVNSRWNCTDTCDVFIEEKAKLLKILTQKYQEGISKRQKMKEEGLRFASNCDKKMAYFRKPINFLQSLSDRLLKINFAPASNENNASSFKNIITKIWRITFDPPKDRKAFLPELAKSASHDINEIIHILSKKLGKYAKASNITQTTLPETLSLFDEKYKYGEYTLKFLRKVKQPHNLVGLFKNQTGNTLYFADGDVCWKTKAGREIEFKLICYNKNELIKVEEPETCIYKGLFASPIACSEEDIEKARQMSLEQLKNHISLLKIKV